MKHSFFILLILVAYTKLTAQPKTLIDSLAKLPDNEQVWAWIRLTEKHSISDGDTSKMFYYLRQAQKIADRGTDLALKWAVKDDFYLYYYFFKQDCGQCFNYLSQEKEILRQSNFALKKEEVVYYTHLANTYASCLAKNDSALYYYQKVLEIGENRVEAQYLVRCWIDMAALLESKGEYQKALTYARKGYHLSRTLRVTSDNQYNVSLLSTLSFSNLCNILFKQNQLDSIPIYLVQIQNSPFYEEGTTLIVKARYEWQARKNAKVATQLLEKVITQNNHTSNIYLAAFKLVEIFHSIQKYDSAIFYAQKILAIPQYNNPLARYAILSLLHQSLSAKGEYATAYKILLEHNKVKNQIDSLENIKNFQNLQIRYESIQKDNQILSLKIQRGWTLLAVVCAILMILMLFFILQRNKKRAEVETAKRAEIFANQEISIINATVSSIAMERKNLSMELHDGVASSVSGIAHYIERLKTLPQGEELQQKLDKLQQVTENIYRYIRDLSHNLAPRMEEMEDFSFEIEKFAAFYFEGSDMELAANWGNREALNQLNAELRILLYRVIQEIFTNIFKYAKAQKVGLEVQNFPHKLILTIWDNGVGFDANLKKEGNGLKNMAERLKKVSGHYTLQSIVGKGTKVTIEIPLKNPAI